MAGAATTVKKPSENSPIKRANRRRCERKQTPQNRVRATKGRSWWKTVEDTRLLAERGIIVSYEAIRYWCLKFGPAYARNLRRKQGRLGDIWHVDELFIKIRGQHFYLWQAVDQDGDVIDILVTKYRDRRAATRFFRKMLQHQKRPPWQLTTDKLRSYRAAHREVFPAVVHRTGRYENNRAEASHQPTRQQETPDETVQINRTYTTFFLSPRPHSELVPSRSSSSESAPSSTPPHPGFFRLERDDVRLLSNCKTPFVFGRILPRLR